MALTRMDNVLIVVEDLEAVKGFFLALGLELEGESTVEGPLVGKLIGLGDVRATLGSSVEIRTAFAHSCWPTTSLSTPIA